MGTTFTGSFTAAEIEARRRWGAHADALVQNDLCVVGRSLASGTWAAIGQGPTFVAAFQAADEWMCRAIMRHVAEVNATRAAGAQA